MRGGLGRCREGDGDAGKLSILLAVLENRPRPVKA